MKQEQRASTGHGVHKTYNLNKISNTKQEQNSDPKDHKT